MMNNKTWLGVNKRNFTVYVASLGVAMIIIVVAFILRGCYYPSYLYDCFVGIGCGAIPTILLAYFIDLANQSRNKANRAFLREQILWGIPYGVYWIAKKTVEFFMAEKKSGIVLKDAFYTAIEDMSKIKPSEEHTSLLNCKKLRESFFKSIDYGVSLFERDSSKIIKDKDYYLMNSVFSSDEIMAISYTSDELHRILKMCRIDEMSEFMKLAIEEMFVKIPEISMLFNKEIHFLKNGVISNNSDFVNTD